MYYQVTFFMLLSGLLVISCGRNAGPTTELAVTSNPEGSIPTAIATLETLPTATFSPTQTPISPVSLPLGNMCDLISRPLLTEVLGEETEISRDDNQLPGGDTDAGCTYYINHYGKQDLDFFLLINAFQGEEGRERLLQQYEQWLSARSEPSYCSFAPPVPLSLETQAMLGRSYSEIMLLYTEAFNSACSPFSIQEFAAVPSLGENVFAAKGFFRVLFEPMPSVNIVVFGEDSMVWLSLLPTDPSFIGQYDALLPDRQSPYDGDREEKRQALAKVFPLLDPYQDILQKIAEKAFLK